MRKDQTNYLCLHLLTLVLVTCLIKQNKWFWSSIKPIRFDSKKSIHLNIQLINLIIILTNKRLVFNIFENKRQKLIIWTNTWVEKKIFHQIYFYKTFNVNLKKFAWLLFSAFSPKPIFKLPIHFKYFSFAWMSLLRGQWTKE